MTVVTGTSTVKGSLLVNTSTNSITFVRTSSILATGSYTVTFRSAATGGFVDLSGGTLAGDSNGVVPGTNFVPTMTVSTPVTTPTLSIPSFARGPNSAAQVVVPNTASAATTGIPITLTNAAANLTTATFTLSYNPAILNITGTLNSGGRHVHAGVQQHRHRRGDVPGDGDDRQRHAHAGPDRGRRAQQRRQHLQEPSRCST